MNKYRIAIDLPQGTTTRMTVEANCETVAKQKVETMFKDVIKGSTKYYITIKQIQ